MQTSKSTTFHRPARILLLAAAVGIVGMGSAAAIGPARASEPAYAFAQVDGMRCIIDRNAGTFVVRDDGQPECAASRAP